MCFASSVVSAHNKLFIANATNCNSPSGGQRWEKQRSNSISGGAAVGGGGVGVGGSNSSHSSLKNVKMSRSKTRIPTEVCGDCGASGKSAK